MASRKHDFPPPGSPYCNFCQDSGLHDICDDYQFCLCPAGQALILSDPGAVSRAQEAKDKLARIGK